MIINNKYEIGKIVKDKRIIKYLNERSEYWKPIKYGRSTYIMTFNNYYRVN